MKAIYYILIISCTLFVSCDTGAQEAFRNAAGAVPNGFTRTNNGGVVQGTVDADDWRTAPFFIGLIRFEPVYQNPSTSANRYMTLDYTITSTDAIYGALSIRAYNDNGQFVLLDDQANATLPGIYSFHFDVSQLSASGSVSTISGKLHRIFVFSGGEIVSYGDLMVE
jgi:hypothetical protein